MRPIHVHSCIYMIDTASIMTDESRRVLSTVPSKTRSETTVSVPPDLVPDLSSGDELDDEESNAAMTMSPAEIWEIWIYKLYGVLVHSGDMLKGRYWALIKPERLDG